LPKLEATDLEFDLLIRWGKVVVSALAGLGGTESPPPAQELPCTVNIEATMKNPLDVKKLD